MPTCVAFGCSNRAPRKGITFHKIPKDEFTRQQWILAIRRKDWTPTKWSRICSDHFHPDDLDRTSVSSTRIRENAVPSIFPAFPAYLQKALEKRRILQKRIISSGKFDNETPGKKENELPFMLMSRAADDTAEKMIAQLQRKLDEAEKRSEEYKKKIKTLQQTNRRYTKRNSQLSSEIAKLKRNKVGSEDVSMDIVKIISPADDSEPVVSEALLALQMSECPEIPVSNE